MYKPTHPCCCCCCCCGIVSKACPQKGCYQCPSYDNPGDNPYYKKKQQRAIHVRAEALIESGKVDGIAKYADL